MEQNFISIGNTSVYPVLQKSLLSPCVRRPYVEHYIVSFVEK